MEIKNYLEISLKDVINGNHDPDKLIFNFSLYELSDNEKNVVCKGLNFSVKPKSIEYSECLLSSELLFRDRKQENLCSEDFPSMKGRLPDRAFSKHRSIITCDI